MTEKTPDTDVLALVKSLYLAFARGDLDAVIATTSADVQWVCYAEQGFPSAGEYHGRSEVRDFFRRDAETFNTTAFVPTEFVVQGSVVIATGYECGTMAVSGVPEAGRWVHVWEFRGSEVIRFREYLCTIQQGATRVVMDKPPYRPRNGGPLGKIIGASIHPRIGIARVGNSDDYYIGAEMPGQVPDPPGSRRDTMGRILRQAARFRVYGHDAEGNVVRELTLQGGDRIEWTVHVANKKSSWYRSMVPMDVPEATPIRRRNPHVQGAERSQLMIDPGERTIAGRGERGPKYAFDTGSFLGTSVYLGELCTDDAGRLVFLGGRGVSGSPWEQNGPMIPDHDYSTTDGWYDDISDGSVKAEVRLADGTAIPCDAAWVITCPPDYATGITPIVTAWDAMYDTFLNNWITPPSSVSFTRDVYPILKRFCDLQWVSYGFFVRFGWGAPYDFLAPEMLRRLADNSRDAAEERNQIFRMFRDPSYAKATMNELAWPPIYGDYMTVPAQTARSWLALTNYQYGCLQQWAAGAFAADWDPTVIEPKRFDDLAVSVQPEALDRAALDGVGAAPCHPGTEVSWPVRVLTIYSRPLQFRLRAAGSVELDYGDELTPQQALAPNGPLYALAPGDITRWQGVPWQVDVSGCQGGYEAAYDEYLPTFWPAHVPNQVLTREDYEFVLDEEHPLAERLKRFRRRVSWLGRSLAEQPIALATWLVEHFGAMGILEALPGPANEPALPPVMYVEALPTQLPATIAPLAAVERPLRIDSRAYRTGRQRR